MQSINCRDGYWQCECAATFGLLQHRSDGVSVFNEPDAFNLLFTFHHTSTGWHTMGSVFVLWYALQVIRLYK